MNNKKTFFFCFAESKYFSFVTSLRKTENVNNVFANCGQMSKMSSGRSASEICSTRFENITLFLLSTIDRLNWTFDSEINFFFASFIHTAKDKNPNRRFEFSSLNYIILTTNKCNSSKWFKDALKRWWTMILIASNPFAFIIINSIVSYSCLVGVWLILDMMLGSLRAFVYHKRPNLQIE